MINQKKYYKKGSLKLQFNRAHVISLISMPLEATSVAISNFTSPFRKSARAWNKFQFNCRKRAKVYMIERTCSRSDCSRSPWMHWQLIPIKLSSLATWSATNLRPTKTIALSFGSRLWMKSRSYSKNKIM